MSEYVGLNIRPVVVNPVVDAASDTEYVFVVKDASDEEVDLSEYTAKMQLRPYPGASKVYDELTTENGRLEIEGGKISVHFPHEVTDLYKFAQAVYDLYVYVPGSAQYRVVQGTVQVSKGVTK